MFSSEEPDKEAATPAIAVEGERRVSLPVDGVLVPQAVLAGRLDSWVDRLLPWLDEQPCERSRQCYLDLLCGLCAGADALRALERGDLERSAERAKSAIVLLQPLGQDDIVLP
ncbi:MULTISPECIES: hypothetical protein [Amycolatopsis]|uniref:Uncharacterized protein n=1 Tax=Amycolatopsis albidoflavus TaxID=102226 RepID=A0ABW5I8S9_9PSEU